MRGAETEFTLTRTPLDKGYPEIRSSSRKGRNIAKAALIWAPLLAWMSLIMTLSSLPGDVAERGSVAVREGTPASWAGKVLTNHIAVHMVEYAVLAMLATRVPGPRSFSPARWAWSGFALCVVYAGIDELHQAFVPRRSAALDDLGYDVLGTATGLLLFYALRWTRDTARSATRRAAR